ncbi:MAG: type II toxin-antitoxin system RelB/DinJ family antitoxin [Phascolarctobacterium sp.]|nr:type II toxin-antitoxin system RelB/DinJ family antitoxin [Phascolarctobacterium sp.]MBR6636154.1 type II toxin-antitoxin system RelB/DinJ family antitoxin [Phascolarctobacterium sp.]
MAAKTANVLARVEPEVKEQAEAIMAQLGIPASVVINMLYKQIIMRRAIPFPLMVVEKPKARDEMSDVEFGNMLATGLEQAERGEGIPADEFFAQIKRELV